MAALGGNHIELQILPILDDVAIGVQPLPPANDNLRWELNSARMAAYSTVVSSMMGMIQTPKGLITANTLAIITYYIALFVALVCGIAILVTTKGDHNASPVMAKIWMGVSIGLLLLFVAFLHFMNTIAG